MSDDPRPLKAILLADASDADKAAFAKMLAEQCAEADRRASGQKWWFHVLTPTEMERMAKYNKPPDYDKCPKCGKGRIVCEITHWNLGPSYKLVCRRGVEGCDFNEEIADEL